MKFIGGILTNILISGAEGYIGRNLARSLAAVDSYKIYSPRLDELDFRETQSVVKYCGSHDISILIHCASVPLVKKEYPLNLVEDNLRLFLTAIACRDLGIKLITFCSGSIYGRDKWRLNMCESRALSATPTDAQSLCKYVFEKYRRESQVGFFNLRLFGIYGGEENYLYKFVPNTIAKALFRLPIAIAVDRCMSNTHISDLIRFLKILIEMDEIPNCDLNFGTEPILLSELAKEIVVQVDGDISSVSVKSVGNDYSGSQTRFRSFFPEFRYTDHRESIRSTVEHWTGMRDSIDFKALSEDHYLTQVVAGKVGTLYSLSR